MGSENIKVTTDQKDWDDFFASEPVLEDAFSPVDLYAARVRVACKFGNQQIQTTNQRLAAAAQEKICITVEFEFDRQVWSQDPGNCNPSSKAVDERVA